MSTTAIAAPVSGLSRSRRIVLGFALFSIAGTGVVTVAPAIAVEQGSGGQPSFAVVAGTGAALTRLRGPLPAYVGRARGLGGAWGGRADRADPHLDHPSPPARGAVGVHRAPLRQRG